MVGLGVADAKKQHLARRPRQPAQPLRDQLAHVVGNRKRLAGRRHAVAQQRGGELEREERVAGGRAVNREQRGAAEGRAQPRLDQLVQGAGAERADADALDARHAERAVETQRQGAAARRAQRDQESDRAALEPASGELQNARGRAVEPLDVVDGDHERRRRGEPVEHGDDRRRDRALAGERIRRRRSEERDLEGVPLRGRERCQHVGLDPGEQIGERRVRERRLRRGGRAGEHADDGCVRRAPPLRATAPSCRSRPRPRARRPPGRARRACRESARPRAAPVHGRGRCRSSTEGRSFSLGCRKSLPELSQNRAKTHL